MNEFNLFEYHNFINKETVLVAYKGPVSDVIMAELSKDIRKKLADNPVAGRKVFGIFIEIAQNIFYYSSEKVQIGDKTDGVGTIVLSQDDEHFTFAGCNFIKNENVGSLLESCQHINSLNREELRKYKREQYNQPQSHNSKGAGIGLIKIALSAGAPLEFEFREVNDEYSFFSLSVKIKK